MIRQRCRHDDAEQQWAVILAKLELHAKELAKQGSLASRRAGRRLVWAVRFVDRTGPTAIQRTVYVGDEPVLISRVRELLASWRAEGRLAAEAEAFGRQVQAFCTSLNRVVGRPRRPRQFIGEQRASA